jgi:GNAT superfamily N-acetyltransferase
MCDEWMPTIKLAMTEEQFRRLPRNAAYRYDYLHGEAFLSPRPKHYHAFLDFSTTLPPVEPLSLGESLALRPVRDGDWPRLKNLFAQAFHNTQPFGSLDDDMLREASHQCLERTRTGGDGPVIAPASLVAMQQEIIVATALVTLVPPGDPCESESYRWKEPPPFDCIEKHRGRPHLTWIFVAPLLAGKGIGSVLLAAAVRRLRELGFTQLLSTFVHGNDSSTLWHWRSGFQLLSYPMSPRLMARRKRGQT